MFVFFATFYTWPDERPADEVEVQSLVRAARVGNARAARRLYALHVARVFRAVRPLSISDAEAEDVTQDTFVKALGSLVKYEPRAGVPFIAWLMTIAINAARKRRARAARTEESSLGPGDDATALHDADVLMKKTLLAALAELPERDRQIVSLRYGAELSADEVAEVVGVSAANVRKICERQRQKLLQRLEPSR